MTGWIVAVIAAAAAIAAGVWAWIAARAKARRDAVVAQSHDVDVRSMEAGVVADAVNARVDELHEERKAIEAAGQAEIDEGRDMTVLEHLERLKARKKRKTP